MCQSSRRRQSFRREGDREEVRVRDFLIEELGRAVLYGIYDLAANAGWVAVGADNGTAASALRAPLATPTPTEDDVWKKIAIFDDLLAEEAFSGQSADNRVIFAFGCVKADLLRFGIRGGE